MFFANHLMRVPSSYVQLKFQKATFAVFLSNTVLSSFPCGCCLGSELKENKNTQRKKEEFSKILLWPHSMGFTPHSVYRKNQTLADLSHFVLEIPEI